MRFIIIKQRKTQPVKTAFSNAFHHWNIIKLQSFWGGAPDPDGGAYSAPPYPLAGAGGVSPSRTHPSHTHHPCPFLNLDPPLVSACVCACVCVLDDCIPCVVDLLCIVYIVKGNMHAFISAIQGDRFRGSPRQKPGYIPKRKVGHIRVKKTLIYRMADSFHLCSKMMMYIFVLPLRYLLNWTKFVHALGT